MKPKQSKVKFFGGGQCLELNIEFVTEQVYDVFYKLRERYQ